MFRLYKESYKPSSLIEEVQRKAQGKPVVVAIGRQDKDKGFDVFIESAIASKQSGNKVQYVFGGMVSKIDKDLVSSFIQAGGIAFDRRVTDEEIIQLYTVADFVWCYYSAKYDQASGILGRAVQFGIPAIVRDKSMMHKFCELESLKHYDKTEIQSIDQPIGDKEQDSQIDKNPEKFRSHSFLKLCWAFGIGKP